MVQFYAYNVPLVNPTALSRVVDKIRAKVDNGNMPNKFQCHFIKGNSLSATRRQCTELAAPGECFCPHHLLITATARREMNRERFASTRNGLTIQPPPLSPKEKLDKPTQNR